MDRHSNLHIELKTMFIEEEWKHYYPCKVCVAPLGHRCGYVGISKKHPLYGKHYSEDSPFLRSWVHIVNKDYYDDTNTPSHIFSVHGGLTFSNSSESTIYLREPAGLWWFGYDCAHGDDAPDPIYAPKKRERMTYSMATVKMLDFCKNECENLAEQLHYLETFYYKNIDRFLEEGLK